MKKIMIALLTMAAANTFAQPVVENREFKSPIWQQDATDQGYKKMYGELTAKGGVEPVKFEIVNTQNAMVTIDNDNEFTSMIIDCNEPASFQYIAIDANNQKSAPATVTLKCGFSSDEIRAKAGLQSEKLRN